MPSIPTLWVLWKLPARLPPAGSFILSFLRPADEEALRQRAAVSILSGRALSLRVRSAALNVYRQVPARIGMTVLPDGRTLRQALKLPGCASRWWFHPIAIRDSESQPVFGWILHILTIRAAVADIGVNRLILVGAQDAVVKTLKEVAPCVVSREAAPQRNIVLGLASRIRLLIRQVYYRWRLGSDHPAMCRFDLVLSGFWDWSFNWDPKRHAYDDRYFRQIPVLLATNERNVVGYFAWFDPYYQPQQQGRSLSEILAPLRRRSDVVLLQRYLCYADIIRTALDLGPWRVCRSAAKVLAKQGGLLYEEIDWRAVFGPALTRGALGAEVARYELVALATERATRMHRPRLTLSFLEHFPYARAHYDGVQRAEVGTANWAMQHASVCREKTFYYLHPQLEHGAHSDGCQTPAPDRVFAMGTLGRDIFLECGYPREAVIMSGSARYDHIRTTVRRKKVERGVTNGLNVLIACSLDVSTEIDMVEAACLATKSLQKIHLRVRNHPSCRVDLHPRYTTCRPYAEVSVGALQDDLNWADLILFSYSTVADEAFIQGLTAWQWLPTRFNGSALAEALPIPQFGSIDELREAFRTAASRGPAAILESDRAAAMDRLFAPGDGGAAKRIVESVLDWLNGPEATTEASA